VGVNIGNDLPPPSTITAVTWLLSPTRRSHVVQYDAPCVTIVAIFSAVDGPVVPPMDRVSSLAVRAQPGFRMSTSSVIESLYHDLGSLEDITFQILSSSNPLHAWIAIYQRSVYDTHMFRNVELKSTDQRSCSSSFSLKSSSNLRSNSTRFDLKMNRKEASC